MSGAMLRAAMAAPEKTSWTDRSAMLLVAGTMFMEILDGTILATAIPHMATHFHVQAPQLAVLITAYLLTLAVLMPLSGWLADRFGSRTIFVSGIALFTIASALCATSQSVPELTALRVLQGAGGAIMVPVGRMVVLRATDKAGLVRAVAYLTWPALAAPVVAPLAGGLFTTYLSWRWIFLVNVPFGIVALVCARRLVPQTYGEVRDALDWAGFVLTAICLVAIVVAASALASTHVDWLLVGVSIGAALATGTAAVRHLLGADTPLLDLRLFRIDTFRMAHTSGTLYRFTIQAVPFLLPLLFQVGFHWRPVKSGAVLLALFVGNFVIKPTTTPLLRRFGFRSVIIGASLVGAATMFLCGLIGPHTPLLAILPLLVASGAARSIGFTAYNTITFADVDAGSMRHANTIAWTAFQISVGIGVALGAVALRIGAWAAPALGAGSATPAYRTAFTILAAITLLAGAQALRLRRDDGRQLFAATAGVATPSA
jgi:EmrB/QacA subfamily drug resistance transporter